MNRVLTLILVITSFPAFSNEAANTEYRSRISDPNYECSWKQAPTLVDFEGEQIFLGQVLCQFLPKAAVKSEVPVSAEKKTKDEAVVKTEPKKDGTYMGACKAEGGDKPYPTPAACEIRNDKSEPSVSTGPGYVVDQKELSAEEKRELEKDMADGRKRFGTCKYSNSPYSMGASLQYKEGYAMLCSSPVECTGGTEPAKDVAICSKHGKPKTVPTKMKNGKMEDVPYAVCPPPEACLVRSERDASIKIVDTKKNASNGEGISRLRARTVREEQFASTISPRIPFGLNSGANHIYQ